MKVTKKELCLIDKCYATCLYETKEDLVAIGCSEGPSEAMAITGKNESVIWDSVGGTMNFVKIPGLDNEFLATRRFVPLFQAADCELNHVSFKNGKWAVTPIMVFPYLHRFDCFTRNGEVYFFGATLCKSKDFPQDWSRPGSVYVGRLSADFSKVEDLKVLYSGITKNHGLWHDEEPDGEECFIVAGVEGAFCFHVPSDPINDEWKIEILIDSEVSDVALCDIDGDGEKELATIEPFHGSRCVIYKKTAQEGYTPVFEYEIDFGHVLWGGRIAGKEGFILGYRRKDMRIYAITFRNNLYFMEMIDERVGPSQVSVVNKGDVTYALFANRQINQLALYTLER